jgi:hypothetical protein
MFELFEELLNLLHKEDVLVEDKKTELSENFKTKLAEYKEKIFNEALTSVDEEHLHLLEQVVEKIEKRNEVKHKVALEQLKKEISIDHSEKLKMVVEMYESKIKDKLASDINDFLDVYLEDTGSIVEKSVDSSKLAKYEKMFENIKEAVLFTSVELDEEIKEAFLDGNQIIESKDAEINNMMYEKIKLTKKLNKIEAERLLEQKTKNLSPKLASYIETRFKNSDVNQINEEFEEVVNTFMKDETLARQQLLENTSSKVSPKKVLTEGVVDDRTNKSGSAMDIYINKYKKSFKYTN